MATFQHYVPRSLLAKFLSKKQKELFVCSKELGRIEKYKPHEVMGGPNYYIGKNSMNNQYDEENCRIEQNSALGKARDKIKDNNLNLSTTECVALYEFIENLYRRTPNYLLEIGVVSLQMLLAETDKISVSRRTGKHKIKLSDNILIDDTAILGASSGLEEKFFDIKRTKMIVLNSPYEDFLISDAPVMRVRPTELQDYIEDLFFVPLNKKQYLILGNTIKNERITTLTKADAFQLNDYQAVGAYDYIAAPTEHKIFKYYLSKTRFTIQVGADTLFFDKKDKYSNFKKLFSYSRGNNPVRTVNVKRVDFTASNIRNSGLFQIYKKVKAQMI